MTQIDTSTEAVEALLDGVTGGPFIVDDFGIKGGHPCRIAMPDHNGIPMATVAECFQNWNDAYHNERRISWKEAQANASFFAESRELVPALLAERDQLRDELDAAYAIIAAIDRIKEQARQEERERTLDAANNYMTKQYGISALGNQIDRARIAAIREGE